MFKKTFTIIVFFALFASNLNAKKLEEIYHDWHVMTTYEDSHKVCYIVSLPQNMQGNSKERKEPYLLVSKFFERKPEVSLSSGYYFKPGEPVKVNVGKKKFRLKKIKDDIAWADSDVMDRKIISSMRAGAELRVYSDSTEGHYSVDTYSLKGFTKSYMRMNKLCSAAAMKKEATKGKKTKKSKVKSKATKKKAPAAATKK
jgi:hypothetical protein